MNILILCTYYPPDIAIAAKRPYMLAKHLGELGHNVTVIRSGEINIKIDKNFVYESPRVKVYSFLGKDSVAEKFERGELSDYVISKKGRLDNLPNFAKKLVISVYNGLTFPKKLYNFFDSAKKRSALIKNCIDNLEEKNFDVVFATYSNLENLYAGEYAAKKFGCKYIADFRDLMAQKSKQPFFEYLIKHRIQKKVIKNADACTAVSNGLVETIKRCSVSKIVYTIYNGYEREEQEITNLESTSKLCFCYTGSMYNKLSDASLLFKALSELENEGKIDRKNIVFNYAGLGYETLLNQAKAYNFEDVLVDYGFLDTKQTMQLQKNSDLFVVLSWNMKNNIGVLTGKLYEAIKNERPVIALVSGNQPNSELSMVISKYNLGLCYEKATDKSNISKIKDYILEQYERKIRNEAIKYNPKSEATECFEYSNIAKQLENIINELVN